MAEFCRNTKLFLDEQVTWGSSLCHFPRILHEVMSAYWLNKYRLIGFQAKFDTLGSLSQCPWKAESKQRCGSTERAGTDSSALSQNINGSDTDAHIESILLDAGVVYACTAHTEAEQAVSGHTCMYAPMHTSICD